MTGPQIRPPFITGQPFGYGSGGGGAVMMPPSAGGPGGMPTPAARSLQLPLPEIYPIPDAHEFNPLGSIDSAAINTSPAVVTGCSLSVPQGSNGVIRGVSLYINNMLATTNVDWSLLIDGQVPQGYGGLTIFPRVSPFVTNGFDCLIRFDAPAEISIVFRNLDGGSYKIGASFSGWFWPKAAGDRWMAYGPQ